MSLEATMTLKNDFVSAAVPGEGTFCLFVLFKENIKSSISMTVMFLVKYIFTHCTCINLS